MMLGTSSYLGLAFGDRAIHCAEIAVAGGRRTVRRMATMPLDDAALENPSAAGAALKAFLREHNFSASRAVVGVPARWLMARASEVPPADVETARSLLSLQAERLSAAESSDMVFDYAGESHSSQPRRVLLVAMLRQQLDRVRKMVESAGLSVLAITSSALALASSARSAGANLPMVLLGRHSAEVVFQSGDTPQMLRHLSVSANGHGPVSLAPLGSELRRAMVMAPDGEPGARQTEMLLFDGVGLSPADVDELSGRLGLRMRAGEGLKLLEIQPEASALSGEAGAHAGQFVPALSLALAGARRHLLPIDLAHSRLAVRPKRRIGRAAAWGIAAGVILVGLYVALRMHVGNLEQEQAALITELKALEPQVKPTKARIEQFDFARGFIEKRPPMLQAFEQVTQAFDANDRKIRDNAIWLSSFTLSDEGKGKISGKTTREELAHALRATLAANPRFPNVVVTETSTVSSGRSSEVNYSITFRYIGSD